MSPRTVRTIPNVQPLMLTPRRDPFDESARLFEPKYDGYRGLLNVTRKGCHFRSKLGNILKRFQELCYWVREELPVKEAILDGEVVALDSEGRQNFRGLVAGQGNLHFAAELVAPLERGLLEVVGRIVHGIAGLVRRILHSIADGIRRIFRGIPDVPGPLLNLRARFLRRVVGPVGRVAPIAVPRRPSRTRARAHPLPRSSPS